MAAQKRSSSKNYIDIVEDDGARPSPELQHASVYPIRQYLLAIVAAMRSARSEAAS